MCNTLQITGALMRNQQSLVAAVHLSHISECTPSCQEAYTVCYICLCIPRTDHLLSHSIHRMKENVTNFAIIRNSFDTILYKGWLCAQSVEWFGDYIADRPYTFSQHFAENRCSNAESTASSSCCTSFILRLKCSECTPS